jgi:hypothetical protein
MVKSSAATLKFKNSARRHIFLNALLFFCLAIIGCTAIRPSPREIPAGPPLQDPQAFLQKIIANNQTLQHLSALSRMKISSPRGSLSVRGAVIARIPACLRVEMFAFLNQLAFLFSTDGSEMSFFLPAQNRFYTGKAADEHLSVLYGAEIRLQEATALFLGYPLILPYDAAQVDWKYDNGRYLLMLFSDSGYRQHVWIDPQLHKIVKYVLYNAAGAAQHMFSFSDFKPAGQYWLPKTIELTFYPSQTHILLTYSDMDATQLPETGLFNVTAPEHAIKLPLRDLSQSIFIPAE